MPTFTGAYIREPSDFTTVATEAALIQVADDPAAPIVLDTVLKWVDLDAGQIAALVATINPIITRKEGIINGYLRAGGYLAPTDPALNPLVVDMAVDLVWNDLRFRKGQLTDEQYRDNNAAVLKQLGLIATGDVSLQVIVGEDQLVEPPSDTVFAIGTSQRIMSRETLEDM